MQWLHARYHSEFAETGNVGGRGILNVLDAMPCIPGAVLCRSILLSIQRQPNRAITDGVSKNLNSPPIQFGYEGLVLLRIPQ